MSRPAPAPAVAKAKTLFSQGMTQHQQGRLTEAKSFYRQVLKLMPHQADALHMLGVTEFQSKNYAQAVQLISRAKSIRPNNDLIHFNLGNALRAMGQLPKASEAFSAALRLRPDHLDALKNLGNTYKEQNLMDKAIACYDRLLAMSPSHPHTSYNKAIALLTQGQLAEGWDLYEYRMQCDTSADTYGNKGNDTSIGRPPPRRGPDWNGGALRKPLLILQEQGLGDQIFYGAMLGDIQAAGMESFVCLDSRLRPLFARSFPNLDFVLPSEIAGLDPAGQLFGAQIHIASLGRFLRRDTTSLARVPSPYLYADPSLMKALRQRVRQEGKLVCGLSWDSKNPDTGARKSMTLNTLWPVLQIPDVQFVDLQYGDTQGERENIRASSGIEIQHLDDVDNQNNIDGLAALIEACDLVITVSNSTAHLAAALGKPTIILLAHHTPLWYWHLDSMTCPWYPSVTLLRQQEPGEWSSVVDTAARMVRGVAEIA
jgi:tetratricopeptide (TPR) repeat protein